VVATRLSGLNYQCSVPAIIDCAKALLQGRHYVEGDVGRCLLHIRIRSGRAWQSFGVKFASRSVRSRPVRSSPRRVRPPRHLREPQALASGATAYLLKTTQSDDLIRMVREVHAGGRPLCPELKARLEGRAVQPTVKPREVEVLRLIAAGKRNREIAALLGISLDTVPGYLKSIFVKLGVSERTSAVNVALRRGIVHIE
jgi:DNA-binding CsgD family transcriptional regulator